jgi:hypothetical protein
LLEILDEVQGNQQELLIKAMCPSLQRVGMGKLTYNELLSRVVLIDRARKPVSRLLKQCPEKKQAKRGL